MVPKISPSSDTLGQGPGADSVMTLEGTDCGSEWGVVINRIRAVEQLICDVTRQWRWTSSNGMAGKLRDTSTGADIGTRGLKHLPPPGQPYLPLSGVRLSGPRVLRKMNAVSAFREPCWRGTDFTICPSIYNNLNKRTTHHEVDSLLTQVARLSLC